MEHFSVDGIFKTKAFLKCTMLQVDTITYLTVMQPQHISAVVLSLAAAFSSTTFFAYYHISVLLSLCVYFLSV